MHRYVYSQVYMRVTPTASASHTDRNTQNRSYTILLNMFSILNYLICARR